MRNTERKPCDNAVVKRIELSMKNRGLNQKQLMKALDLPVSVFTQWKYDNGKSYTKYIDEISKILDVSSEYLLSGKEKIEPQRSGSMSKVQQAEVFFCLRHNGDGNLRHLQGQRKAQPIS